MSNDFNFQFDFGPEDGEVVTVMMIFYLIYYLVMFAICIASYVLQSVGLYSIAKRRGIKHPGVAWLPVGCDWIMGCISDQYRYVVKGQVKNKRKALLVLEIIMWAVYILLFVLIVGVMIQTLGSAFQPGDLQDPDSAGMIAFVLGIMGLSVLILGLCIPIGVIRYMALYDLYTSCEPRNNVVYLVLNIFISITVPILLFVCRKKDLGMPPRKPQPVVEAWTPMEERSEPWENQ